MASLQIGAFTFSPKGHQFMKPSCYKRPELRCHRNGGSVGVSSTHHIKAVLPPVPTQGHDHNFNKQRQELGGIGIVKFFKGKNIFLTGATGFVAKVLLEKLLRTIPDVGKIYVMINAESQEAATKRLKDEIVQAEVFKRLEQVHGKSYESFMLSKLIPVAGNLCKPDLGFDRNMEATMAQDVDIIINSAANTNFRERFDVAVSVNVKGAQKVMTFAKKCKKLNLFLQISTAYVNGERKGYRREKAFRMAESFTMENHQPLNIEDEMLLTSSLADVNVTSQEMKRLGLQRAKIHGWENIYVFTKAMGEMLLGSSRGDVPLVILRPSIIESTYTDPFPGWIEGNRMMDPVITFYGKGQIFGLPSNPDCPLDGVPVDMVVNAALAAIAKHGESKDPRIIHKIPVYHVSSSVANPMLFKDWGLYLYQYFAKLPFFDSNGEPILVKPFNFYDTMEDYLSHVEREMMRNIGHEKENMPRKLELLLKKSMLQAKYIGVIYEPYGFYQGRFDNTNAQSLVEMMLEEERRVFHFDVRKIDWKDYMVNIHIPGLRRHVLKE